MDTAGMGLPVLEFRLNAPILSERKRGHGMSQVPLFREARVLGIWILGDRFLFWIKHQNRTRSHRSGEGGVFFPKPVVKSWAPLPQSWGSQSGVLGQQHQHPLGMLDMHILRPRPGRGPETQGWSQQCAAASRGRPGCSHHNPCPAPWSLSAQAGQWRAGSGLQDPRGKLWPRTGAWQRELFTGHEVSCPTTRGAFSGQNGSPTLATPAPPPASTVRYCWPWKAQLPAPSPTPSLPQPPRGSRPTDGPGDSG